MREIFRRDVIAPGIFLLWLMLLGSGMSGQEIKPVSLTPEKLSEVIFSKNHFSLSFMPYITSKATIKRSSDKYNVQSTSKGGFEIGVDYHIIFSNLYTLVTGLHTGVAGRNVSFLVPKQEFNPPLEYNVDEGSFSRSLDASYVSIPVSIEKKWLKNNHNFWSAGVGFNLRYSFNGGGLTNGRPVPGNIQNIFFNLKLNFDNNEMPWVNYNFCGGYSWLLRNNNFLRTNLVTNISFTKFVNGSYEFILPNQPVNNGSYGLKGSYVGLSISYVFSNANNRLRKLIKAN